jgi:methylmalonyl-CoA mutase N-terminal domain/subunit
VALQAFSATAGGCQSLHTNGFDEALALPTEESATLALRTQQILADESGVTAVPDPFGGSYYVERLTDELAGEAARTIARIDELGGAVAAIESGWMKEQIEQESFETQLRVESGAQPIVGVNRFVDEGESIEPELQQIDPQSEARQVERLRAYRADRDQGAVDAALGELRGAASSDDAPLCEPLRAALEVGATVGETCGTLRVVWGTYDAVLAGRT